MCEYLELLAERVLTRMEDYYPPDDRVVQMIPAPGWSVYYYSKDSANRCFRSPLVAWGLTESGFIKALDSDDMGDVMDMEQGANIVAIVHESTMDRLKLHSMVNEYEERLAKKEESTDAKE